MLYQTRSLVQPQLVLPLGLAGHRWVLQVPALLNNTAVATNLDGRLEVFVVGGDTAYGISGRLEPAAVHGQIGHPYLVPV